MSPRRSSRSPCRPITPGIPETWLACRPPDRSAWVRSTTRCTSCFAPPLASQRNLLVEEARPRLGIPGSKSARARTDLRRAAGGLLEALADPDLPPLRLRDGRSCSHIPGHVDGPALPLHERTRDCLRTPSPLVEEFLRVLHPDGRAHVTRDAR